MSNLSASEITMEKKGLRWGVFLHLLLFCVFSTNCGTTMNLANSKSRIPMGGVVTDTVLLVQEGFQDPGDTPSHQLIGRPVVYLLFLDAPLSFVADVGTLPYTVPYTIFVPRDLPERKSENKSKFVTFYLSAGDNNVRKKRKKRARKILSEVADAFDLKKSRGNQISFTNEENSINLRFIPSSEGERHKFVLFWRDRSKKVSRRFEGLKQTLHLKGKKRFGEHFYRADSENN